VILLAAVLQQFHRFLVPFRIELQIISILVDDPKAAFGASQSARLCV
jgi:hypothetical protein